MDGLSGWGMDWLVASGQLLDSPCAAGSGTHPHHGFAPCLVFLLSIQLVHCGVFDRFVGHFVVVTVLHVNHNSCSPRIRVHCVRRWRWWAIVVSRFGGAVGWRVQGGILAFWLNSGAVRPWRIIAPPSIHRPAAGTRAERMFGYRMIEPLFIRSGRVMGVAHRIETRAEIG